MQATHVFMSNSIHVTGSLAGDVVAIKCSSLATRRTHVLVHWRSLCLQSLGSSIGHMHVQPNSWALTKFKIHLMSSHVMFGLHSLDYSPLLDTFHSDLFWKQTQGLSKVSLWFLNPFSSQPETNHGTQLTVRHGAVCPIHYLAPMQSTSQSPNSFIQGPQGPHVYMFMAQPRRRITCTARLLVQWFRLHFTGIG